jgi:hypothetical protein
LVIPIEFSRYTVSPGITENFLLIDTGPGADRILAFGRQSWVTWFPLVKEVFYFCLFLMLAIAFVPVAQAAAAFVALSAGANAQLQVNIFFPIFFLF